MESHPCANPTFPPGLPLLAGCTYIQMWIIVYVCIFCLIFLSFFFSNLSFIYFRLCRVLVLCAGFLRGRRQAAL